MSIAGCIPSASSQIHLPSPCTAYSFAFTLDIALGFTEINKKYFMRELIESNTEIRGFYISVDEYSTMEVLEATDHLVGEHKHCFEAKLAMSLIEEGLEGRAEQFHHQYIEIACNKM
jgi:hypothetical protein